MRSWRCFNGVLVKFLRENGSRREREVLRPRGEFGAEAKASKGCRGQSMWVLL